MFTGLVEEIGTVRRLDRRGDHVDLSIAASTVLGGTILGDSIAVNGVCLTVTALDDGGFVTGLAPETLKRSNLGDLAAGARVNLERSVLPTTRLGGHFVQGHVDATGTVQGFRKDRDALWLTIGAPAELMKYIVTKGYITLDGTSLTVVDTGPDWFNVTLIAYTQAHIILPEKKPGDRINIEVDVLGKYVERQIAARLDAAASGSQQANQHGNTPDSGGGRISAAFLEDNGFG